MSAPSAIRVVGLIETSKPTIIGERKRAIARFDVNIADLLTVCGVGLVRGGNAITVSPPRFRGDPTWRVEFTDPEFKREISRQALAAYVQMGGKDLPDWALTPGGDKHEQAA